MHSDVRGLLLLGKSHGGGIDQFARTSQRLVCPVHPQTYILQMRRMRTDKSSQWTNNGETLDTCQEHGGHIFPMENEFDRLLFKETNEKKQVFCSSTDRKQSSRHLLSDPTVIACH
ncbi:unnamed protein product [Pleuronectes platessa]|uniref:Uncharacterized protein n=1 Tax=Pleuronectes platessa TaxID=8262 RepID=A0A9N7VK05_PLEPL|nr:unnamed protein product [Pleuronectes platessa]